MYFLQDTRVYDVSLSTSSSNNNIASVLIQAFTILDCGFNTNCTSCTNSDSPCGWCLYNSRCVSDLTMCDMQEWIEVSNIQEIFALLCIQECSIDSL